MKLFKPNIRRLLKKKDTAGLIRALSDSDLSIRSAAVSALGEIGDEQSVEALIDALQHGFYQLAADALVKIGAPSVGPLIDILGDKRDNVRDAATNALVKIGTPAVQPLIVKLTVSSQNVRQAAARALGEIGDVQAIESLVTALKNGYVCQAAADALVKIGVASVGPLVATLATLENDYVREVAAEALAKIGLSAVGPLVAALEDKHAQQTAAYALYKLGWKPGAGETDEISAIYWIANNQWQNCIEIGTPALGPLTDALEDKREDVRQAIASALDKLGWQPGIDEASARYYITKKLWHKCIEIGEPAVEALITVLEDRDRLACRDAAWALGEIGDARAVQPLVKALGYKHYPHFPFETAFIRQNIVLALGKIGDAQAVEALISALEDDWFVVRRNAVIALGLIGDTRATEPLIRTLHKDRNWRVGLISYIVLKQIPGILLSEVDVQQLVNSLAEEIRFQYAKTSQAGGSLVPISPNDDERPDYVDSDGDWWKWNPPPETKPDPDIPSIRSLIGMIPEELRERVSALSGDAKGLF